MKQKQTQQVAQAPPIIEVFNSIKPLTKNEVDDFISITREYKILKGELWIKENSKNEQIAFLQNGYLRKYYMDHSGREITDFFYFPMDFCTDLPSIIGKSKPASSVVAMEETSTITFSYHDFDTLRRKYPSFERIYSVMLEQNFLRFYNRTISFIHQSPGERYNELVKTRPMVLQKATQYHIASYLGISYQHLSRLRSAK